jgi:uncharacterized protein YndB with AHSA1/START domain
MKWLIRIVGVLVAIVVVALVGLLAVSRRPGAGKCDVSVEIAQPPQVVWAWITEPDKLTQWVGWLSAVESDTTTAMGVGHREVWVMNDPNAKQPMRIPCTVTAEDAPRKGAALIDMKGMFLGTVEYTLTDLGNGHTRLTQKTKFTYSHPMAALMEPFITPQAQKKQVADFARLKAKAEAAH